MRIMIIADIHGNADALEALPSADVILCAGDTVTFGPEPNACIDWLVSHNALCIRGDEDDAVAYGTPHQLPPDLVQAGTASRSWTRGVLTAERLAWLRALPPELELVIAGRRIALVHAYPGDYNRYLTPNHDELDRLTRAYPRADIIVIGHTHRQAMWRHAGKLVLNPGSVGQNAIPGRAAYLFYDDGGITYGSARYEVACTAAKIRASSLATSAQDECIRELTCGSERPCSRLAPLPKVHA